MLICLYVGASIKAQQFGIATRSQGLDTGLMGLSFGNQIGTSYPNIVDQLAAQNITQSRAFSLDLGSIDTPEGKINKPIPRAGTKHKSMADLC